MALPPPPSPPNPPPSLSRVASSAVPRAVFDCIQKFHAGTPTTNTTTTTTNLMRGNTPHARISLNVAGGCATAVQWLLAVPRASNTVLDAKVLYSRESVAEALAAGAPGVVERATRSSSCSRDTAKDLAKAAYRNAIEVHYARRKTTTTTNDDVASANASSGFTPRARSYPIDRKANTDASSASGRNSETTRGDADKGAGGRERRRIESRASAW